MADRQMLKDGCASGGDNVTLAQVEQWLITATLERCRFDARMAARYLGVSRRTVYNRMHDYGLLTAKDAAP